MVMDFKKHTDDLLFVPLGGTNEIGMNVNLYQYRGKWLLIDFGIGFADDYLPGVDVILPNIEFLKQIKGDLLGLVLTHAHEDHMGALPYLWHEIGCDVYATPFTAAVLKRKMAEDGFGGGRLKITEVKTGTSLELAPFTIDLVDLTHSIPEMQALAITTDFGTIIHTGDWKLDPIPLVGPVSNEEALRQYGEKGVLALLCDSTNVFVEGESGSESVVREELKRLIALCEQRVLVTCFASNIARVESIIRAGHEAGRRIALAGKSLFRITQAAQESGYLQGIEFISDRDAAAMPRNEVMIICTGCQGESRAALSKIAQQSHQNLRVQSGDTVIFSSRVIPGNETKVHWLYNKLSGLGVDIITERDMPIHVSGHPARDELERMYQLVKPKIAVPVHGEPMHIHEHARFARMMQVPHVIEPVNGAVICLASEVNAPGHIGSVKSGYVAVDGISLLPVESTVLRNRRKIRDDGVIIASLVLDKDGIPCGKPMISAPGSLDEQEDGELIDEMEAVILEITESGGRKTKDNQLEQKIRSYLRKTIARELGKRPVLEVHIHRV